MPSEDRDSVNAFELLRALAQDVKDRGDVGEPGFITVERYLEYWAERFDGPNADLAWENVTHLLDRAGYRWRT